MLPRDGTRYEFLAEDYLVERRVESMAVPIASNRRRPLKLKGFSGPSKAGGDAVHG